MEGGRKEVRSNINLYFQEERVKHTVRVFAYRSYQMIDVEYEDFLSEDHVEEKLRALVGPDFLINVKRECSEEMLMEIHLYNMTMCEKSERPKTIYAARTAVMDLIPKYERSWMYGR